MASPGGRRPLGAPGPVAHLPVGCCLRRESNPAHRRSAWRQEERDARRGRHSRCGRQPGEPGGVAAVSAVRFLRLHTGGGRRPAAPVLLRDAPAAGAHHRDPARRGPAAGTPLPWFPDSRVLRPVRHVPSQEAVRGAFQPARVPALGAHGPGRSPRPDTGCGRRPQPLASRRRDSGLPAVCVRRSDAPDALAELGAHRPAGCEGVRRPDRQRRGAGAGRWDGPGKTG